jgi:hypothetical protein
MNAITRSTAIILWKPDELKMALTCLSLTNVKLLVPIRKTERDRWHSHVERDIALRVIT